MVWEYIGCFIMLGAAFITDIKSMKIPNLITMTGLMTGLAWHLAWIGVIPALSVLMYSIFAAGLIGVLILIGRREMFSRMRALLKGFIGAFFVRSWEPVKAGVGRGLQIPFMLAVMPGAVVAVMNLA